MKIKSHLRHVFEKSWKPILLDLVELIMAFEDKFGGEISDEDAQKITTVGEVVIYIETRMKN